MNLEMIFSASSALAMLCWAGLILWPGERPQILYIAIRNWVGLVFAVIYAAFFAGFFFQAEGSFGSMAGVRQLFQSDELLLAGWIHYLAFDLFVGTYAAERMSRHSVNRAVQVLPLILTFMCGPIGWLVTLILTTRFSSLKQVG